MTIKYQKSEIYFLQKAIKERCRNVENTQMENT